ncbi:MAG: phage tail tape measure protein [Candidatus Obscuribacterales bacterium]|nr:phage tail tape measure protein [Candidatus Obscuribacterales bacterium]
MFGHLFNVGVSIHLVDKVSAGLAQVGLAAAQAQGNVNALQAQFNQINAMWNQGQTIMNAGMALAAPLGHAVEKAAELQKLLLQVQVATVASAKEMGGFDDQLAKISHSTIFSMAELAKMSAAMGHAGIRTMPDIRALLPQFAASAEILYQNKHEDPTTTVDKLAALAHQFGKYTVEEMKPIVETVTKLALKLPGGISSFATMGSYLNAPAYRKLKIDPTEILTLEAAAMQTTGGGGGRGRLSGAAIEAAFSRIIPGIFGSGLLTGKSAWALNAMGLSDEKGFSTVFKDGKLSLKELFDKLGAIEKFAESSAGRTELGRRMMDSAQTHLNDKQYAEMGPWLEELRSGRASDSTAPAEILERLFKFAFGVTGGGALGMMADPKFQEQLEFLKKYVETQKSIEEMQQEMLNALEPRWKQFTSDMQNVVIKFAMTSLPIIQRVVEFMDLVALKVLEFEQHHPKITQFIFLMTAAAAGILIVGGAIIMLRAGFMALSAILPTLSPWLWAVVAAVAALVLVVQNWDQILQFCRDHIHEVKFALAVFLNVFPLLKLQLHAMSYVMTHWTEIVSSAKKTWISLVIQFSGFIDEIVRKAADLGINITNPVDTKNLAKNANAWADQELKFAGLDLDGALAMPKNLKPAAAGAKGGNINVGSLHIHQQPGQDSKALADDIMQHLSKGMRNMGAATTTANGSNQSAYWAGATD